MTEEKERYAGAKEAQDVFRDAVKFAVENDVANFQIVLNNYRANPKNPGLSLFEIVRSFQSEGQTLMHVAANSGSNAVINYICSQCSTEENTILANLVDNRGYTPLINAATTGSIEVMKQLLKIGADVNAQNKEGASAMHHIAGDGSIEGMQLLRDAGGQMDLVSKSGNPLHWAAGRGKGEAVKFLVDHWGTNESNNDSAVLDLNAPSPDGSPPVLMAAAANSDLAVKVLTERGADIGFILSGNLTVLHICAEHGLRDSLRSMVATAAGRKCCEVETTDGNKPIHYAAMSADREAIMVLLPYTTLPLLQGNLRETAANMRNETKSVSVDPSSLEKLVDWILQDGARRLDLWHKKYSQPPAAVQSSPTPCPTTSEEPAPRPGQEEIAKAEKYKSIGNDLYRGKKFAEAIRAYTSAIELDPSNAVFYSNRSACYLTMKENEKALSDAETCRRLRPDWARACHRLASARLALDMFEDAAVAAFEGCKLEENNAELKALLQKAVKLGQEEHRRKTASTA